MLKKKNKTKKTLDINIREAQSKLYVMFVRNWEVQSEFLELRVDGSVRFLSDRCH